MDTGTQFEGDLAHRRATPQTASSATHHVERILEWNAQSQSMPDVVDQALKTSPFVSNSPSDLRISAARVRAQAECHQGLAPQDSVRAAEECSTPAVFTLLDGAIEQFGLTT